MEYLNLITLIAGLLGLIVLVMLILAPLKLYDINRELQNLNATMKVHTRLLAAIANATSPVELSNPGSTEASG